MMSWLLMWLYKNVTIINPTLELLDAYIDILIDWLIDLKKEKWQTMNSNCYWIIKINGHHKTIKTLKKQL